jgi:YgiT-type zinc finger domain-containing protein
MASYLMLGRFGRDLHLVAADDEEAGETRDHHVRAGSKGMGARPQDPEEVVSRCIICKTGDVQPGTTTLTVERGRMTLVLKGVPARVCGGCSEAYFDEATTRSIEATVDRLEQSGVRVAVQDYAAA